MAKDWIGNSKSTFTTLGASSHTDHDRAEHDFYATDPKAIDELFKVENFNGTIWEPAAGVGHLSNRIANYGKTVYSSDLVDRGYGEGNVDFLKQEYCRGDNIITNPPYKYREEFVRKALELVPHGGKVAMFLKLTFLESEGRISLFEDYPPTRIWVFSKRILCGINGDFFAKDKNGNTIYDKDGNPKPMSSATCYAWFVWDTTCEKSAPVIGWINKR